VRLLVGRAERIVRRVVRYDLSLALDATLEFLADFIGRSFRNCATDKRHTQTDSAKNAGNFHPGSIEKRKVMAIPIPPELLLRAYRQGAFPMAVAPGDIRWFSPQLRGILPLESFHIPHGTRRALGDPVWEVRVDTAFREVMQACAKRDDTWIDAVILESYGQLWAMGHAHSVEVWRDGELVGGLYGVSIDGVFFGESMFHRSRMPRRSPSSGSYASSGRADTGCWIRNGRHRISRSSGRWKSLVPNICACLPTLWRRPEIFAGRCRLS